MYRGSLCDVGDRIDTSPYLFIVSNHEVFTMLLSGRGRGLSGMSKKSILRKHWRVYDTRPKSLVGIRAFTQEHPRTRRCTIHPRTQTTTLTHNTTNHVNSVHIWISLATVYLFSRVSGCALLIPCWSTREWVVAALGRLETLERNVSSGAIVKDRRKPSSRG